MDRQRTPNLAALCDEAVACGCTAASIHLAEYPVTEDNGRERPALHLVVELHIGDQEVRVETPLELVVPALPRIVERVRKLIVEVTDAHHRRAAAAEGGSDAEG